MMTKSSLILPVPVVFHPAGRSAVVGFERFTRMQHQLQRELASAMRRAE